MDFLCREDLGPDPPIPRKAIRHFSQKTTPQKIIFCEFCPLYFMLFCAIIDNVKGRAALQ
jgi:hypothetical protein